MDNAEGFELIARHLSPHKARAYQAVGMNLVQDRRHGVWIHDLDGRAFVNCRSSGGVFNFGHHVPWATEALCEAVREHDMGDWLLPSARRAQGGAALACLLPEPLRYSLHGVGRRGGRGRVQARPVGDRQARARVGRARVPRARRLLIGHGRPAPA